MMNEVDIAIVGGGWTGLSAALALQCHNAKNPEKTVSFVLLEGDEERLGGRVMSVEHKWTGSDGEEMSTFFENGAQYIGRKQTAIWALVQQAIQDGLIESDELVDGYAARLDYKDQVMKIAGRRYEYDRDDCLFGIGGVPPNLGIWDVMGSMVFIQSIEMIERSINVLEPWKSPRWVQDFDNVTLDAWISEAKLSPAAEALMRVSIQAVLSVSAEEVSAFYFFWYCACNEGFLNLVNDEEGGPQQYYLSCGLETLMDKLAAPLMADHVQLGRVIESVVYGRDGATLRPSKGETIRAKKVIFSTTLAAARSVRFEPELPQPWPHLLAEKMGTTLKCKLFYRTPWWRNASEEGAAVDPLAPHYTGYCGANNNPVIWVMDYSPPGPPPAYENTGCYCLMSFTIDDYADKVGANPTDAEVAEYVTTSVAELLNDTRALSSSEEYLSILWHRWDKTSALVPGGPNTVFGRHLLTRHAEGIDEPVAGTLLFACSELSRKVDYERSAIAPMFLPIPTATSDGTFSDWRQSLGYMDGAITCGRYAARAMLIELGFETRSVAQRVENFVENSAAELATALIDGLVGESPPPKNVTVAQAGIALKEIIDRLYVTSKPQYEEWSSTNWESDPAGLQEWLLGVVIDGLIRAKILEPAPVKPTQWLDPAYWKEYLAWQAQLLEAVSGFVRTGYASSLEGGEGVSADMVHLTRVADALMALKSTEPFLKSNGQIRSPSGTARKMMSPTLALRRLQGMDVPPETP